MKSKMNYLVRLSAFATLLSMTSGVFAQDGWQIPRTSYGHPDIQGVFTNNTTVPFERPGELGEKAFYTVEEYEAMLNAPRQVNETQPGTNADVHYETGEFGLNADQKGLVTNLRTSLLTKPADGRLPPMLDEAQRRSDEARARQRAIAYNRAQDRPLPERCVLWTHVGPPLRPISYNTTVQIMQTEDHVVLMSEMIHDSRIIPLVNEIPEGPLLPQWQGNSFGRWEGDKLIIETRGFREEVYPRGTNITMSEQGRVIEKISRTGPNTLLYEFEVIDPTIWAESWGGEYPMMADNVPMFEYACHEGNYGIANILSGAREDERKAREAETQ